ncbi:hypothetical protein AAC387_Pa02g3357 [Persea americana]
MAPEYITTGRASQESDIYSFGIVLLEIACGRRSIEHDEESSRMRLVHWVWDLFGRGRILESRLVQWVWDLYGKGRILESADERLKVSFDATQMECLMIVGLWCAHPDHNLRPSIQQATQVRHFEASIPNKMPVPLYMGSSSSAHSNHPSSSTLLYGLVVKHNSCILTLETQLFNAAAIFMQGNVDVSS